jgi:oxygen-independent coproporphyrinogen-3 oxidase
MREAGVYVHVPFCRRRCPYCDFYFEVGRSTVGFVAGVEAELEARAHELVWPAATLSFGGGTPSQLSTDELASIVAAVKRRGLVDDAEISLEVNPEDIDVDVARGLKAAGFTRVSVGMQSFDDEVLRWLGRGHDGAGAAAAVAALVSAGLNVGVDFIVGVPCESPARLHDDLARAAQLGVVHISTYLLTVEEGTPLVQLIKRGARAPVDDDAQATAYERIAELAEAAGFAQYEVSSHAREGHLSRHNRLYWGRGDYLGLGPGAHSLRIDDDGRAHRRHTTARLDAWLADPVGAAHDDEVLEQEHALREAIAFGLRDLSSGVDLAALSALHHAPVPDDVRRAVQLAAAREDLVVDGDRCRLTRRGARFADRVARDVLVGP